MAFGEIPSETIMTRTHLNCKKCDWDGPKYAADLRSVVFLYCPECGASMGTDDGINPGMKA